MRLWIAALTLGASAAVGPLQAAQRAFEQGDYQSVEPLLKEAWKTPLNGPDLHRALELEALTRAAFDQTALAIEAFQYLLGVDPQYLPDPQASPKLLGLFAEARRRGPLGVRSTPVAKQTPPFLQPSLPPRPEEPRLYQKWWFWTGLAVVAGAAAAGTWYELKPSVPNGSLGTRQMQ